MRIYHEVSEQSLQEAVGTRQAQWKQVPLARRYNTIALILKDVKNKCPDFRGDTGHRIETKKEPFKQFFRHEYVLSQITDSIEHSEAYKDFLTASRQLTTELISDSSFLSEAFDSATHPSENDLQQLLWEIHLCQVEASNITAPYYKCSIPFKSTSMTFSRQERSPNYSLLCGSFSGQIDTNARTLKINLHEDVSGDIFTFASTVHHETIHDQGFQLGVSYDREQHPLLGGLTPDGEIWQKLEHFNGMIPSGFYNAYRRQCTEAVAFEHQALFKNELRAMFPPHSLKLRNPFKSYSLCLP